MLFGKEKPTRCPPFSEGIAKGFLTLRRVVENPLPGSSQGSHETPLRGREVLAHGVEDLGEKVRGAETHLSSLPHLERGVSFVWKTQLNTWAWKSASADF